VRRISAAIVIALSVGLTTVGEVRAQGLFQFFFGPPRPPAPPPEAQPYAPPFADAPGEFRRREPSGSSLAYCVRLCDGRYFPVPRQKDMTPAETCSSFCPAAKTKIYSGGEIDHAVAKDGSRYADLDHAYLYRDKVVADCTCNGKDAFGLAHIDVSRDPTLRPGDIVATQDGMEVVKNSRRGVAEFTPVDRAKVSAEMRQKLSQMRVWPEAGGEDRAPAETTGVAPREERRAQSR
jgi:hypothetical protein